MRGFFQSAWTGAVAIMFIGGIIGASVMGIYIHHKLNRLIEPTTLSSDEILLQTMKDKLDLNPEQLDHIRKELEVEKPLRALVYLEALPILNRPKYETFAMMEREVPPEKRQEFLRLVANSIGRRRPQLLSDLYKILILNSAQFRALESIHSEAVKKGDLPTDDSEKAAYILLDRTKTSVLPLLTAEQQKQYEDFLVSHQSMLSSNSAAGAASRSTK